jgi:hypothetical protein
MRGLHENERQATFRCGRMRRKHQAPRERNVLRTFMHRVRPLAVAPVDFARNR